MTLANVLNLAVLMVTVSEILTKFTLINLPPQGSSYVDDFIPLCVSSESINVY